MIVSYDEMCIKEVIFEYFIDFFFFTEKKTCEHDRKTNGQLSSVSIEQQILKFGNVERNDKGLGYSSVK